MTALPFHLLRHRFLLLVLLWLASLVTVSLLSPYFLQASTIPYFLQYVPVLGLLAIGQTFVMIGGGPGIDISVGSMLSLTGVFMAWLCGTLGVPVVAAALAALAFGGLLGLGNGILINHFRIASLMATLATFFVYGGLALALTDGRPVTGFPDSFAWLTQAGWFGLPHQFLYVFVPVAFLAHVFLSRTRSGNHLYACGTNAEAARLVGVPVARVRLLAYVASGVLAGLAAVVNNSWFMSARPDAGTGLELLSVTIVVLGGTHIFGGEGSIRGTLVALFVVTTLQIGLELAGVSQAWQLAVVGLLLILAVALGQSLQRR